MTEGDPMVTSIGYSLGIGSGLDTQLLIQTLSDAARAPKEALIDRREQLNSARISALADASGAIDSFAPALPTLVSGGPPDRNSAAEGRAVCVSGDLGGRRCLKK